VEIHVLQGERPMAADNKTLGKFSLANIPSAPRGIPQIEVTFDIDANGIVNVSAKDRGTGQEQKITISGSTALSDDEVEKLVKDAESHGEEDRKRKETVEVRNGADTLVYTSEKTLKDLGDKVPEDTKKAVEDAAAEVRKALEGDDLDDIKAKTDALQQASFKLAEIVYQTGEAAEAGGEPGAADAGESQGDEEVADFEVVDDDGKK
jgi:molecular chaperone DnaK